MARLLIAVALIALPTARAQTVSASADRARVSVGESVALTVRVEGREAAGAVVEPPDADGLSLVSRTPSLRALSSINGRATLTMRWLYVAESVGRGRIGEVRVFAAGRTLRTDPIEIVVAPSTGVPSAVPPPPGTAE